MKLEKRLVAYRKNNFLKTYFNINNINDFCFILIIRNIVQEDKYCTNYCITFYLCTLYNTYIMLRVKNIAVYRHT